ncbi:PREDICTED: cuticle collagen 2C-like [Pseudopodoces humilis]|uniref:cuticle collagen 2C-like n=1 Tax=Pseudopodoces humilis TaxID=181119 RepID=UPI0006B6F053|nr:PREDICTED: cuticle collagen 2C-like [Pseudopodoces humilis]
MAAVNGGAGAAAGLCRDRGGRVRRGGGAWGSGRGRAAGAAGTRGRPGRALTRKSERAPLPPPFLAPRQAPPPPPPSRPIAERSAPPGQSQPPPLEPLRQSAALCDWPTGGRVTAPGPCGGGRARGDAPPAREDPASANGTEAARRLRADWAAGPGQGSARGGRRPRGRAGPGSRGSRGSRGSASPGARRGAAIPRNLGCPARPCGCSAPGVELCSSTLLPSVLGLG